MGYTRYMKASRYMADISSNNGPVDIARYSRAGHVAIAIKASEGRGYKNPFHMEQCATAHSFGLTVAHYHFARPGARSISDEIANFRNAYMRGWRPGDYLVLDLEVVEGPNPRVYAEEFISQLERATGHPVVLYTYEAYRKEHLENLTFPGKRMWVAKYSDPAPTGSLWAWQYTDGVDGPEPHFYSGIGKSDGSILNWGVSFRLAIRKKRTRKVK